MAQPLIYFPEATNCFLCLLEKEIFNITMTHYNITIRNGIEKHRWQTVCKMAALRSGGIT